MKFLSLLVLFLCIYKGAALVSIFCFEGQHATGRYVYYKSNDGSGAVGCCIGGAGSVLIYYPSTTQYLWYNCPATIQTRPLHCHRDYVCSDLGYITSSTGGTAVDECCYSGYYNTFNVLGLNVCVWCVAPFQPPAISPNMPPNKMISAASSPVVSVGVVTGCLFALLQV